MGLFWVDEYAFGLWWYFLLAGVGACYGMCLSFGVCGFFDSLSVFQVDGFSNLGWLLRVFGGLFVCLGVFIVCV